MRGFFITQRVTAALFMLILIGFSALNFFTQKGALAWGLSNLKMPQSPLEARAYIGGVEGILGDNIFHRLDFIEGYAYLQVLTGKNENDNFDLVRSRDGFLNFGNLFPNVPYNDLKEYARRVWRLRETVAPSGCKVFFLAPPDIYIKGETRYAAGIPGQNQNSRIDAFLFNLQKHRIPYIDARDILKESSLAPSEYFLKTDPHWTVQAVFEVFIDVVEMFEREYGLALDPDYFYRDINNYNVRTYPEGFSGSLGARGGYVFSRTEDVTLIWPKFDSDYRIEKKSPWRPEVTYAEGPYTETLLEGKYLNTLDAGNLFLAYMGGMMAWAKITNKQNPEGKKLLLIHDSYSNQMVTFLAPMFSEIHTIWPLAETGKVDIEQYLSENTFDYIIVEQHPGNLDNDDVFSFFREPLESELLQEEEIEAEK